MVRPASDALGIEVEVQRNLSGQRATRALHSEGSTTRIRVPQEYRRAAVGRIEDICMSLRWSAPVSGSAFPVGTECDHPPHGISAPLFAATTAQPPAQW